MKADVGPKVYIYGSNIKASLCDIIEDLLYLFKFCNEVNVQGGSIMTGTNCDLFTHISVPVIFEPPCIFKRNDPAKSQSHFISVALLFLSPKHFTSYAQAECVQNVYIHIF